MKVIAKLIDMMHDELEGAEEYAMCALKYKSEHPKLAQRLNELAGVELQHLKILHSEVDRLIEDYRSKEGEPPADMLAVYNYEHEKMIKEAAKVKTYISDFDA